MPSEYKIHLVFHARLLKPAIANDPDLFPKREPLRPEPVSPDEEEYKVEKVLDHREVRNEKLYLVHWLGYPDSDDSWVKEEDMYAPELAQEYWKQIEEENPPQRSEQGGRDVRATRRISHRRMTA